MANYTIFDEDYYIAQYPWVQPAIDAGVIQSGREHFEKFGQAAGLTQVSRYFDEATYLAGNPDIAALVRTPNNPNAPFATGLDHFIQYGYEEGRTRVSPDYDEAFYLAREPRLQGFIQNGTFKNGYQHFIQFGRKEGLFGTSFNETGYLQSNPDVRQLVESGALKTGREHYFNFGKNEPNRSASFSGTSGNDILTGVGVGDTTFLGVKPNDVINPIPGIFYGSDGSNEFDTLTGGSGRDTFVLSRTVRNIGGSRSTSFTLLPNYIGPGFATIRNFTPGQDIINIGLSSDQLLVFPINNNRDLAIQRKDFPTIPPDTIAVIEGGGNLTYNQLITRI
jgi:hypothetical protein